MEKISIDLNILALSDLSINEYLTLYKHVYPSTIDGIYAYRKQDLLTLEQKGFVKLFNGKVILRHKANELFHVKEDFFLKWLLSYPIKVRKSHGGTRSLSPASDETILGRKLRAKWMKIFKGNPEGEKNAIKVLDAEVAMRKKSGDLEYMVEAARWLNEGFHEKYSYLIEEPEDGAIPEVGSINYDNQEDYM